MIDIENKILSVVRDAVLAQYPNASIYGEYVEVPDSFPCVTVTEETNYTYTRSLDAELGEHPAVCAVCEYGQICLLNIKVGIK